MNKIEDDPACRDFMMQFCYTICPILDGQGDLFKMKIIIVNGGDIKFDDITLTIESGCFNQSTEIKMKYCQNSSFNVLRDLKLIDAVPQIYEFSPIEFSKPARLTIRFKNAISGNEPFILRGYHRCQRTVWELVINGVKAKKASMKIKNTFAFCTYIFARRETLARILGHINNLFACRAYIFYRRSTSMETIDISIVIVSEFVDEKTEEIEKLNYHLKHGYVKGEKGNLKPIYTDRNLEMCLDLGVEIAPFTFKIDSRQLDTVGFVVNHFEGIATTENLVSGSIKISYESSSDGNELLWKLNVEGEIAPSNLELLPN